MTRDGISATAEALEHLTLLRTELARQGLESELVTTGARPRLRLRLPYTFSDVFNDFNDVFDDNVVAAEVSGEWMFVWPWAEPIAGAHDPAAAAESILVAVCLDVPGASKGAAS